MTKSVKRTLIPSQLVVLLIILVQPALLRGQQLAVNTQPEIFARPTTGPGDVQPSFAGDAIARAERTDLVMESNMRTITPAVMVMVPKPVEKPLEHHFWDRQNRMLFAANGAMAAVDFAVTRHNLATHGKELNPVAGLFAGSTPALATNFAMETGGVIGVSYWFHKTGHHKLERITSYANLGASAFAVSYGLSHR